MTCSVDCSIHSVTKLLLEFFLNRTELSVNSGNLKNKTYHWSVNWCQLNVFSVNSVLVALR